VIRKTSMSPERTSENAITQAKFAEFFFYALGCIKVCRRFFGHPWGHKGLYELSAAALSRNVRIHNREARWPTWICC
jgi:hypothetical protein